MCLSSNLSSTDTNALCREFFSDTGHANHIDFLVRRKLDNLFEIRSRGKSRTEDFILQTRKIWARVIKNTLGILVFFFVYQGSFDTKSFEFCQKCFSRLCAIVCHKEHALAFSHGFKKCDPMDTQTCLYLFLEVTAWPCLPLEWADFLPIKRLSSPLETLEMSLTRRDLTIAVKQKVVEAIEEFISICLGV